MRCKVSSPTAFASAACCATALGRQHIVLHNVRVRLLNLFAYNSFPDWNYNYRGEKWHQESSRSDSPAMA
jgi:hypothetical protein